MATQSKDVVLEHEFLPIRAKILEVAAALDRLDRADDSLADGARRDRIDEAIRILLQPGSRAEQVQRLFSREYDARWREEFQV
jgi:hypothetical protein